ncbi:MAG: hypothetical protein CME06_02490 [Gemmatimonadetes bacterium]|nr:hypothetical protein [Gemmatimonadota bacterium]
MFPSSQKKRSSGPATVFLAALLGVSIAVVLPAGSTAEESTESNKRIRLALDDLVAKSRSATWFQRTWERKGDEEERTESDAYWAGQDRIRLDIHEGRGAGSTAILRGNKVTGFKRGWLSFAKMSFDVDAERVLSLRGHSMAKAGFFDDCSYVLEHWDEIESKTDSAGVVLRYRNAAGNRTDLWLDLDNFVPMRMEVRVNETVVARTAYERVVLNPLLDDDLFE